MWRAARADEDEAVVAMCLELYGEDPSPEPVPETNVRGTIARLRAEPARGRTVVLEREGGVTGYAFLVSFWSNELGGELCSIDELYVRVAARGHGHASRLVSAILEDRSLWPRVPVALELEVSHKNVRARALYERLGFTPRPNACMRLRAGS